ncbi:MAG: class I SAM-dependent DNA methyltransferase [Polyangiales bacterium]
MADLNDSEVRRYYDEFSRSYDDERGHGYHRMVDDLEFQVAETYARDAAVLELGCGTGLILERVARVAKEAIGIDISRGMAARAIERGLEVRIGSVCELPFEDERFDLTYSFKVLAHVPEVGRAVREAARVTRRGGHLVLEFYNPWSLRYLARRVAGPRRIGAGQTESDVFTRWDSPRAVRALLPPELTLVEFRGVRVLTPVASIHRAPLVGPALRRAEELASGSPLRNFGGFLVAVLRKS